MASERLEGAAGGGIREIRRFDGRGLVAVGSLADLEKVGEGTSVVHLTSQEMVKKSNIEELLRQCPDLSVIEIPKSIGARMIRGEVKELLLDRRIKVRYGRFREGEHYDRAWTDERYLAKRQMYSGVLSDTRRKEVFDLMLEMEMEEAEYGRMYYGGERVSVLRIAESLGISPLRVQQKLEVFGAWMGWNNDEERARKMARRLEMRAMRLKEATEKKDAHEKLRREHAVGGTLPPERLPPGRWAMWGRLMELAGSDGERIDRLRRSHSEMLRALSAYYQLGNFRNSRVTMDQLAEEYGLSREAVRLWKNRGLAALGLFE